MIAPFKQWHPAAQAAAALVGVPVAVYAYKCAMMVAFQHELIYMRRMPPGARGRPFESAKPHGLVAADVILPRLGKDPSLHGLYVKRNTPTKVPDVLVVYLQGNGGNIAHRFPKFRSLLDAVPRDVSAAVLAVGYRGYGTSRGAPSERGLIRDAARFLELAHDPRALAEYVPQLEPAAVPPAVVLYGHSLGGAVAVASVYHHYHHRQPASPNHHRHIPRDPLAGLPALASPIAGAVVLENTFTSLRGVVQHLYPSHSPIHHLHPFLRSRWESLLRLQRLPRDGDPTRWTFLSGTQDEMVPPRMMEELRAAVPEERATWVAVPGGLHNSTWEHAAWRLAWSGIVRRAVEARDARCRGELE
ncbi:hypothetical protein H9P43_005712 [Blastocladiella emersonii ATCC 22665]|nr:hypothetical protein H9P43_005712 [Blastocladiella emersonii ATCC 22665]